MSRTPYGDLSKAIKKKSRRKKLGGNEEIDTWRLYYRDKIIEFIETQLVCPPDVPVHPELGRVPEYVLLSEDQKDFILYLIEDQEAAKRFILAAGRGAGKTFCIALYVAWRLCCWNDFTMTVMGGSSEQSLRIKEYIDFWRDRNEKIFFALYRSVAGGNQSPRVWSRWNSYARFPACSDTSARGPHVTQLFIDEVCVGEAKSTGAAKAIRSSRYQLTSSSDSLLGLTSTAQYILGTFYYTWVNAAKLGYRKFRWAIAKHKSAMWLDPVTKEPNWEYIDQVLYKDKDVNNWTSNVWWMAEEDIKDFRLNSSDDEFLVEVLGGMSRGSGLVFSRADLRECICNGNKFTENGDDCEDCEPYTVNCPMMTKRKLKLSMIGDRKGGVDFGEIAPNALTILGKRGPNVYVLYSDELTGEGSEEVLAWIINYCEEYVVWEIFADPEERAMRQALENRDLSTPNIWRAAGGGRAKNSYVNNTKRYVERHWLFIPKKFGFLVDSVYALAYDSKGKIRKHNDHSFDSLWMGMADYDVDEDITGGFYKGIDEKERKVGEIWKT